MQKKSEFSAEDWETISHYLKGGLAIGGGAGLAVSLLNYLKKMNNESTTDSSSDDDTLYVYRKKANFAANGTAITTGVLSTLLSYLAVTKAYQKFREAEAQKALDEAQHVFLDEAGYKSIEKSSSGDRRRGMNLWEGLAASPVALSMLMALAGGVTVNELLKARFPTEKKQEVKAPRRIEVLSPEEAEAIKMASYPGEETDAQEFLCRMTLINPVKHSGLLALQKVAALGGHEAFKHTAMQLGFYPALDTVKGASAKIVDPVKEHLALCWMNKCAYLRPSVGLLAASEFAEQYPTACRQAAHMDEEQQFVLRKIASLFGRAMRSEISEDLGLVSGESTMDKKASSVDESDVLSRVLTKLNEKEREGGSSDGTLLGAESVTDGDENESTGTSGEEAGINDDASASRPTDHSKLNFINNSKSLRSYSGDLPDDAIDKLLSPGK